MPDSLAEFPANLGSTLFSFFLVGSPIKKGSAFGSNFVVANPWHFAFSVPFPYALSIGQSVALVKGFRQKILRLPNNPRQPRAGLARNPKDPTSTSPADLRNPCRRNARGADGQRLSSIGQSSFYSPLDDCDGEQHHDSEAYDSSVANQVPVDHFLVSRSVCL